MFTKNLVKMLFRDLKYSPFWKIEEGDNLRYDYSKLRGKIREVLGTQDKFAKILGISEATLSKKLNNGSEFTQKEIRIACDCLKIEPSEIPNYFFSFEV